MTHYHQMGVVRLLSVLKVWAPSSLEWVKLGTSNFVCILILMNISVSMLDYPRMWCVQGHVTSLNFGE